MISFMQKLFALAKEEGVFVHQVEYNNYGEGEQDLDMKFKKGDDN